VVPFVLESGECGSGFFSPPFSLPEGPLNLPFFFAGGLVSPLGDCPNDARAGLAVIFGGPFVVQAGPPRPGSSFAVNPGGDCR